MCSFNIIIPPEMRAAPRWLLWRHENGKKPPIAPDGHKINPQDSAVWFSFNEALAAMEGSHANGIGFVLGGGFGGLDLDNCIDESGNLCQWAKGILRLLPPTYSEISPSGRGVELVFRTSAKVNRRKGPAELYTSGRYFTVVGKKLPEAPAELATVPEETIRTLVLCLHLVELAAQIETGKFGAEVAALFKGDILGYSSHSEADLALISFLNQRCGLDDPAHIDFVFRLSDLYREKWQEVHSADGQTYGEMTISKVLRDSASFLEEDAVEKLLRQAVPADRWVAVEDPAALWEGILFRGAVHLLAGRPKCGKSRFLHDLLATLTASPRFLTVKIGEQTFVLHDGTYWGRPHATFIKALVITEESRAVWKSRGMPLGNVDFLSAFAAREAGPDVIAEIIRRNLYDLIVLDTMDKVLGFEDENDNAEIARILGPIVEATHESQRTAVLLLHHYRKSGGKAGKKCEAALHCSGLWMFTSLFAG